MNITHTPISGVCVVENSAAQDSRGAFSRLFCERELQGVLVCRKIVQINLSLTTRVGAVRGLHYQNAPEAEMKIVRCLKGRVLDVAVDLRLGSPTFLQWTAVELSPCNRRAFVIPEGCAHGFQVLEQDSELLYLHTAFYTPEVEGAVRFNDPSVGIKWPLEPTDLSTRDSTHQLLDRDFRGIVI